MVPLFELSEDELFVIMTFFAQKKDILALADSCSTLHNSITQIVQERKPLTLTEPWTLPKAVSQFWGIHLTRFSDAERVFEHMKTEGALEKISSTLDANYSTCLQDLEVLCSIKRGRQITLPSINVNLTVDTEYDPQENVFDVVSGHEVQHLKIGRVHNYVQLCNVLHNTINLESLSFQFSSEYSTVESSRLSLGHKKRRNEEREIYNRITLPMLDHLTKIHVEESRKAKLRQIANLIMLAPMLQEFHLEQKARNGYGDDLLDLFVNNSFVLEKLHIQAIQCTFTNDGILNLLATCPIRELKLYGLTKLTGKLFETIGDVGQSLEVLVLHADLENGPLKVEKSLPNLRELGLQGKWNISDEFVDSIIAKIPNLRVLGTDSSKLSDEFAPFGVDQMVILIEAYDLVELSMDVYVDSQRIAKAINKKKNLRVLKLYGHTVMFPLETLQEMYVPSLIHWQGLLNEQEEYMKAFREAFPNASVL